MLKLYLNQNSLVNTAEYSIITEILMNIVLPLNNK